jgi:hypothetical protein
MQGQQEEAAGRQVPVLSRTLKFYMWACVCVHVSLCAHMRLWARVHTSALAYVHMYLYACVPVCTHASVGTCAHVCTCICAHVPVCTCTRVCAYVYMCAQVAYTCVHMRVSVCLCLLVCVAVMQPLPRCCTHEIYHAKNLSAQDRCLSAGPFLCAPRAQKGALPMGPCRAGSRGALSCRASLLPLAFIFSSESM